MPTTNPFSKFSQQREVQHEKIEAKLTGTTKRGRPRKRKNAVPVNILLAYEDKVKLMELAEEETLSMNDLITQWIRKAYEANEKKKLKTSKLIES